MKTKPDIIGLLVSDVHLRHKVPIARSNEPDWYKTMERYLLELEAMQYVIGDNPLPVFYTGDIFHLWNSPPELINFALKHLPNGYGIPGQHDLPLHNEDDIHKSAYWTLVKTGKIKHLLHGNRITVESRGIQIEVSGFGWNKEILPVSCKPKPDHLQLALIHKYLWRDSYGYPNSSTKDNIGEYTNLLKGYDAVAIGDNHKGWMFKPNFLATKIINCGSFMATNSDQRYYRPMIGVLYADGNIEPHYMDVSKDKWVEKEEMESAIESRDFSELAREFKTLIMEGTSFISIVKRKMKDPSLSSAVKQVLISLLENEE